MGSRRMERVETVIIGGGQAGLATGLPPAATRPAPLILDAQRARR